MGGLDTHAYMLGEWSAGLLEVAPDSGCSMALIMAHLYLFPSHLGLLVVEAHRILMFILVTKTMQAAHGGP